MRLTAFEAPGDHQEDRPPRRGPGRCRSRRRRCATWSVGSSPTSSLATHQSATASADLRQQLPARRQPQRAALGDLDEVVGEPESGARRARPRRPRGSACRVVREHQVGDGDRHEDDQPAHRRGPRLGVVLLGPSSRICWPNSLARRKLDELRPEEDRDQHRRHPGDQDLTAVDRPTTPPRWRARPAEAHRSGVPRRAISSSREQLEADGARALDQDRVARLEHRLGQRHRRLARRAPTRRARSRGPAPPPPPSGRCRDGGRGRRPRGDNRARLGPSSPISPSTATRRPSAGQRSQVIERRAHRDRVGVVAVVHEHDSAGSSISSPRRREKVIPGARRAISASGTLQRHPDRDRRQGVREVVRLAERERESAVRQRGCRSWPAIERPSPLRSRGEDVAARAERDRHQPVVQVGLERLGVRRDNSAIRRARARPGSPPWPRRSPRGCPSSSRCTGPTLVIAATSGSAISHSSAIWPAAAHRHLEHQHLGLGGAVRTASGRPISVL